MSRSGCFKTMAPEVIARQPYDCKADVWSAGMVLLYMLKSGSPFNPNDNDETVLEAIMKEGSPTIIDEDLLDESTRSFLAKCFINIASAASTALRQVLTRSAGTFPP